MPFEHRLRQRGEDATCAEWVAYLEAKADIFERITEDRPPWPTGIPLGRPPAKRVMRLTGSRPRPPIGGGGDARLPPGARRSAQAMIQGNTRPRVIGPVWQVPLWWVILAGLLRTLGVLRILAARHPAVSVPVLGSACVLARWGRTAYLTGLASAAALLILWALLHRASWLRVVGWPLLVRWRRLWTYRRHWDAGEPPWPRAA